MNVFTLNSNIYCTFSFFVCPFFSLSPSSPLPFLKFIFPRALIWQILPLPSPLQLPPLPFCIICSHFFFPLFSIFRVFAFPFVITLLFFFYFFPLILNIISYAHNHFFVLLLFFFVPPFPLLSRLNMHLLRVPVMYLLFVLR
ncbi:hypothetical protein, unlikely [Trypanosoma brucei gambiense DAL972]|uniref:Uncharacterized protein n=1 Tax=Trypanosoma brucei gambiense (strain MHOM/CI/86/DAL972) TaxID=679716 RepID=D0A9X3_TRYB9|nr:hypothetical protein, unlikely [Trypanosoma brucei gambiense DAL972]CBH18474.1 hypothetical protein, unlikely [Trypanosoma brucei gambiense DAL972]|eukprot:XP_011780738.1 hypothetical protein, unlikely [Trypanosoma brucei gambiense DAL972]